MFEKLTNRFKGGSPEGDSPEKEEGKKGLPSYGASKPAAGLPTYSSPKDVTPKAETKPSISVFPEPTPNPSSVKFSVMGKTILRSGGLDFPNVASTTEAPLARELFKVTGVGGVFLGTNFVTITKTHELSWPELMDSVIDSLKAYLESDKTIANVKEPAISTSETSEIETKIRSILDNEIRPAVARDGGDVVFHSYEDGVVTLTLRGSCSSCPSSIMTLKMGIENRLKAQIPEVTEVNSL
ncbi:MAG: NifU family protein [Deltaproteobacteria bacterium]|nr:NifU family protein [Deltaproteobacteria bacterium]